MTGFQQVQDFNRQFGLARRDRPTAGPGLGASQDEVSLRHRLVEEEVGELADAVAAHDLVGVADALADIVYVALGMADLLGIPFDAVFAEVHRANMSKLGADGRPVLRADGKVAKGPGYSPPDVTGVLAAHRVAPSGPGPTAPGVPG